jgi:hypothetical protein
MDSDLEMKASTASSALGGSHSSPDRSAMGTSGLQAFMCIAATPPSFWGTWSREAPGQLYSTQTLAPLPFRLPRSKSDIRSLQAAFSNLEAGSVRHRHRGSLVSRSWLHSICSARERRFFGVADSCFRESEFRFFSMKGYRSVECVRSYPALGRLSAHDLKSHSH